LRNSNEMNYVEPHERLRVDSNGNIKQPIIADQPRFVDHPQHYQGNGIEVIDIIEAFELNFIEGNIIKYLLRYKSKNGLEDLKKSQWYLQRLIDKNNV